MAIKGMSRFIADYFCDGIMAFNQQRFSLEDALKLYREECDVETEESLEISEAFVRWRYGQNEDGEPVAGWFLESRETPRSVPVWRIEP